MQRITLKRSGVALVTVSLVIAMIPALTTRTSSSTFLFGGADAPPVEAGGLLAVAENDVKAANYGQALEALQEALRVDPHYAYAAYDIGDIYQRLNRSSDAIEQYEATLEIDPGFERALYNLGYLSANAGDAPRAILYYQRAITADPNDASAHFNLGLLLRQSSQSAEGDAQIRAAVTLSPSLASAAAAQGVPGYTA